MLSDDLLLTTTRTAAAEASSSSSSSLITTTPRSTLRFTTFSSLLAALFVAGSFFPRSFLTKPLQFRTFRRLNISVFCSSKNTVSFLSDPYKLLASEIRISENSTFTKQRGTAIAGNDRFIV